MLLNQQVTNSVATGCELYGPLKETKKSFLYLTGTITVMECCKLLSDYRLTWPWANPKLGNILLEANIVLHILCIAAPAALSIRISHLTSTSSVVKWLRRLH